MSRINDSGSYDKDSRDKYHNRSNVGERYQDRRRVRSSSRDKHLLDDGLRDRSRDRSRDRKYEKKSESRFSDSKYSSNKNFDSKDKNDSKSSKFSSEKVQWGKPEHEDEFNKNKVSEEVSTEEKAKANFGLTGALAKDTNTGNVVNGQVLKFSEPLDAEIPTKHWRLYVFKGDQVVETLYIHRKSVYLVGRDDRVADIVTLHESCSKQHAVIQFRGIKKTDQYGESVTEVKPYLMDLGTAHKTYLNGKVVEEARYYELREKDVIKFGASTRDYVLLHDNSNKED